MADPQAAAQLYDFLLGPLRWQVLRLGFELGLFERLTERTTATALAALLELAPAPTECLLKALCSLGLVQEQGGQYSLSAQYAPYLLRDSTASMLPMLLHLSAVRHASSDDMTALLRGGRRPATAPDFAAPEFWRRAQAGLHSYHRSIATPLALALLQDTPTWKQARHLLDFGAGSADLAKAAVAQKPTLQVTLFDLPPCAEALRQELNPTDTHFTVIAGDMNDTPAGTGYDLIWCGMALYYARDLPALLQRLRAALAPGGIFMSLHEGLHAGRTLPEPHVLGRLLPALGGQDLSFDRGVIAAALNAAGFANVESREVRSAIGPLCLDIGYKP